MTTDTPVPGSRRPWIERWLDDREQQYRQDPAVPVPPLPPALLTDRTRTHQPALIWAVIKEDWPLVHALLEAGVDASVSDGYQNTAAHHLFVGVGAKSHIAHEAIRPRIHVLAALMRQGWTDTSRNQPGMTPSQVWVEDISHAMWVDMLDRTHPDLPYTMPYPAYPYQAWADRWLMDAQVLMAHQRAEALATALSTTDLPAATPPSRTRL